METIKLNIPQVRNLNNPQGKPIPQQFIIKGKDFTAFQSYNTIIAVKKNGKTYFDAEKWKFSTTTSKYRNLFTGVNSESTEKLVKDGTIILTNLNT